jgi:CRP/FNR family transcriptional regulator, cyclic AMP receptor protein
MIGDGRRNVLKTVDETHARDALRACTLFRLVDDATLTVCARELQLRRFRRGETIFHQGDPGDALHVVRSGSVRVVLPSPTARDDAILVTLGPGEFFGELAILDGQPHSATVVAGEPAETLVLRRDAFDRLLDREPLMARALLAALAGELRRLTGHVEALHFLDLPGRLAKRILQLAEAGVPGERREVRLDWPYTQSELAAMIGGSRESVNRLMGGLVAAGVVRMEGDSLVIADLDRLAAESASR